MTGPAKQHSAESSNMQGHIDMVCEKNNDVQHDFHKDALKLIRKGEWLKVAQSSSCSALYHAATSV